MSHLFEIIPADNETTIVVGKTYYGLGEFIEELETELCLNNIKGEIIFDLLLANGLKSSNRFMHSYYNGINIYEPEAVDSQKMPVIYRERINLFYKNNLNVLNNGILLKKDIETIKNHLEIY